MAANEALLHLLTWLSPAFPTGGFAYSHGLEWSVEASDVADEAGLVAWLRDILAHGALKADAALLRRAHSGEDVAGLAEALALTAERRLETSAQGHAFCEAARPWGGIPPCPYPVAVGMLAARHRLAVDDAVLAYLHAAVANLVSAGLRLIPLGQAAGLRCQAALAPAILAAAQATPDDLGTCCWAADIAAMRHETQYTRLFRT